MDTNLFKLLADLKQPAMSSNVLVWQMILTALGPLLAGMAAYYAAKAMAHTRQAKTELVGLTTHINSRMTDLLKASSESAHAAGHAAGQAAGQAVAHAERVTPLDETSELRRLLAEARGELALIKKLQEKPLEA